MTWRETIKQRSEGGVPLQGKFRTALFIVPNSDATVGRRTETHEYPRRDKPYVEDLGRRAREFQVEVFVDGRLGGDYLAARDALIAAIEERGPGTLVHPWYGSMTVSVTDARVRESTREGGRATFTLTFVESGELSFPAATADSAEVVKQAAKKTLSQAIADFGNVFSVLGLASHYVEEIEAELNRTLAAVEGVISGITGPIADLIRAPADLAVAITGSINRIGSIITEPARALGIYKVLFNAGADSPSTPTTTPQRRQQARSVQAIQHLVRRAALVEAANTTARANFSTAASGGRTYASGDVLAVRDDLLDGIDAQLEATDVVSGQPIDDAVYNALQGLRAAVAEDLRVRGAKLPRITYVTPTATLPALVLAHRIYGDATRADELVARNRIRHPGFVPGGEPLEVLHA